MLNRMAEKVWGVGVNGRKRVDDIYLEQERPQGQEIPLVIQILEQIYHES